jgi:hypothetical protein
VGEFAEQQAIEGAAIGDIGDAADCEFFALSEPARKPDGSHEFAGGASDSAVFAVAAEFFDQAASAFGHGQIRIDFCRQRI